MGSWKLCKVIKYKGVKAMPNWCMNTATISGDIKTLENIEKAAKENNLLEYLSPIGEWEYNTAINTWGTKWDVSEVESYIDYDEGELVLNFDSAWSPPIGAYQTGEELHNISVMAYYYEPGMEFVGKYSDGEDQHYNLAFSDKNWRETIPDDIIDTWNLEDEYTTYLDYMADNED